MTTKSDGYRNSHCRDWRIIPIGARVSMVECKEQHGKGATSLPTRTYYWVLTPLVDG